MCAAAAPQYSTRCSCWLIAGPIRTSSPFLYPGAPAGTADMQALLGHVQCAVCAAAQGCMRYMHALLGHVHFDASLR